MIRKAIVKTGHGNCLVHVKKEVSQTTVRGLGVRVHVHIRKRFISLFAHTGTGYRKENIVMPLSVLSSIIAQYFAVLHLFTGVL